ncbi:uncharacterized protein METZ01_LOCUS162993, partial [marine metagenome]
TTLATIGTMIRANKTVIMLALALSVEEKIC